MHGFIGDLVSLGVSLLHNFAVKTFGKFSGSCFLGDAAHVKAEELVFYCVPMVCVIEMVDHKLLGKLLIHSCPKLALS